MLQSRIRRRAEAALGVAGKAQMTILTLQLRSRWLDEV